MTEHTQAPTARLGQVLREADRVALRYERLLPHPPEKVWRAITESENLRHWFPADIVGERRAGARVSMPFWPESVEQAPAEMAAAGIDPDDPTLPGEIRSWSPPRLFELIWGDSDGTHDVLRFELQPESDSTRLVFTTWLGEPGPAGHAGTGAGYHLCLDKLEVLLDPGFVEPADHAHPDVLQARYAALFAE